MTDQPNLPSSEGLVERLTIFAQLLDAKGRMITDQGLRGSESWAVRAADVREAAAAISRLTAEKTAADALLVEVRTKLERAADTLLDIGDRIADEGDRAYLGSTNDTDAIRALGHELKWEPLARSALSLMGSGEKGNSSSSATEHTSGKPLTEAQHSAGKRLHACWQAVLLPHTATGEHVEWDDFDAEQQHIWDAAARAYAADLSGEARSPPSPTTEEL